jgi:hypothetical protein
VKKISLRVSVWFSRAVRVCQGWSVRGREGVGEGRGRANNWNKLVRHGSHRRHRRHRRHFLDSDLVSRLDSVGRPKVAGVDDRGKGEIGGAGLRGGRARRWLAF